MMNQNSYSYNEKYLSLIVSNNHCQAVIRALIQQYQILAQVFSFTRILKI